MIVAKAIKLIRRVTLTMIAVGIIVCSRAIAG